MEIHKACAFINMSFSFSESITQHTLRRVHIIVFFGGGFSACVCAYACECDGARISICVCGFSLCVQHSLNQIQQKVFVYLCFPLLWFALILIPI